MHSIRNTIWTSIIAWIALPTTPPTLDDEDASSRTSIFGGGDSGGGGDGDGGGGDGEELGGGGDSTIMIVSETMTTAFETSVRPAALSPMTTSAEATALM